MSDKNLVLVESILTYRIRHVIEQNKTDDPKWAMDTVTMGEADEFSQLHLGDQIISHRIISEDECYKMFKEDNDYLRDISFERMREIAICTVDNDK